MCKQVTSLDLKANNKNSPITLSFELIKKEIVPLFTYLIHNARLSLTVDVLNSAVGAILQHTVNNQN